MEFQHHPDNIVLIRGQNGELYQDTPENFTLDLGEAYPSLPEGYIERIYVPGPNGRHILTLHTNEAIPQPGPWTFGDYVLSNLNQLLEQQQLRRNSPPPPDNPPQG